MNVLSLFAGIGGIELGLERAGMTVVGQVELDPFCRSILEKHWPDVPQHDDVRTAVEWWTNGPRPPVDVICGGFPCQPFSHAGAQKGVADERWGWPWMLNVIAALSPTAAVIENVPPLLRDTEAFSIILSDLSNLGFDVEWDVVSACSLGAPHPRRRLFMVAHPHGVDGRAWMGPIIEWPQQVRSSDGGPSAWRNRVDRELASAAADGRSVDGVSVEMVRALGNAVVPQVSEYIGRQLIEAIGVAA